MADVAKQLRFSPVSPPPPSSPLFGSEADGPLPVRRLHDSLLGSTPAAATGSTSAGAPRGGGGSPGSGHGHKRPASFRVPSDDEEEDDDGNAGARGGFHGADGSGWRAARHHHGRHHASPSGGAGGGSSATTALPMSWGGSSGGPGASARHPVQTVLEARTRQLQADALLLAEQQQRRLHDQLQSVELELARELEQVQQQLQQKRARAAAADEQSRLHRSAERQQRLADVQRQQAKLQQAHASAQQEVKRAQEEAARKAAEAEARRRQQEEARRKAEADAAARAAAAKAAEEAKAREEAAAAAAAAAKKQQEQQQQPPAATAAAAAAPAAGARPAGAGAPADPHLKASVVALELAARLAQKLADAEAAAAELTSRPELKAQRRALEKQITMAVSQISGTQQQVQAKSRQLVEVLQSCSTPQQAALAHVTLASRVVSQCEGQVQKLGSFAFPLAYVCVAVGAAVPAFMELLLAKLQQSCPLLVPQYTMFSASTAKEAWFRALGYKDVDDPKTGERRRETADEFVARCSAMVLLYGAIVQTDAPGNPAGLAHGWAWLARCLNTLPPTRPTASALMSFLAHAGFRLASAYGRQFAKVMAALARHYLPALEAKAQKDADLRAVGTRLATYVTTQQYRREPEGRTLKKVDESQYTRA